jgi:hypothetical protein
MQKFFIFLSSFVFFSLCSFKVLNAQINYNKYIYPDVDRRTLDFDFFLRGVSADIKFRVFNFPIEDSLFHKEFGAELSFHYNRFYNTRKKQKFILIRNISSIGGGKLVQPGFSGEGTLIEQGLNVHNGIRFYNKKKLYSELTYGADVIYYRLSKPFVRKDFLLTSNLGIRFGIGRTEPAAELFDAMFIIDDLKEKQFDVSHISEKKLFQLAQLMAKARQRRILDFRRERLNQLESVSQWFVDNLEELTAKEQILLNTIIADNWNYNFPTDRSIGNRISIGVDAVHLYNNLTFLEGWSAYQILVYGELFYTKPLSRYFHRSYALFPGVKAIKNFGTSRSFMSHNPFLNGALNYSYYPNSRTRFNVSGQVNATYLSDNHSWRYDSQVNIIPRLFLSTEYFINYQFRVLVDFSLEYRYSSGIGVHEFSDFFHEIYAFNNSLGFNQMRPNNFTGTTFDGGKGHRSFLNIRLLYSLF